MTFQKIKRIVQAITYKPGWYVRVELCHISQRCWLQIGVDETAEISYDPIAKKKVPWRGSKKWLSEHMCRQEIVGIVFSAFKDAEMHEVHEWFRYKGASIYNPHLDPDVLVEVARKKASFNVRENAMQMEN